MGGDCAGPNVLTHTACMPIDRCARTCGALPHRFVSAIIPARDEAACITAVVQGLLALRDEAGVCVIDEVVVADNGSSDGTGSLAARAGAKVVCVPTPGYGRACWEAVQASSGKVLLFVDGDGAAAPADAPVLLQGIDAGADLVIGVRARPEAGSMSLAQRFGNELACVLMRGLWRLPARDLGPYRAITRSAFDALDMHDRSFGWTVEMQVRAHQLRLRVAERDVGWYRRAGGHSKVSGTWRGVFGAGVGILGMIARLWWRERRRPHPRSSPPSSVQVGWPPR